MQIKAVVTSAKPVKPFDLKLPTCKKLILFKIKQHLFPAATCYEINEFLIVNIDNYLHSNN